MDDWTLFKVLLLYASNKLLTLLLLPHAYSICVQLIQILVLPFLLVYLYIVLEYENYAMVPIFDMNIL